MNRMIRFLEIAPGLITWIALIAPFILSFYAPIAVGIFILVFDLYWIYKAVLMSYHLLRGFYDMQRSIKTNWDEKITAYCTQNGIYEQQFYNAVILTTYQEDVSVIRDSLKTLANVTFDHKRIIFVLATEERDKTRARENAQILKKEFGDTFFAFLVTEHPDGIVNEVKAKGANATWAGKALSVFIKEKGIDSSNVIVSTVDADTQFHPKYFSALTHAFITNPDRIHRSFQPIPIFANNIWEATPFARIMAFGSTFWQMVESTRPWRLINFSSHAMSLKTLEKMDYWDVTVVNEDSRQFWRAYYAFHGNHEVIPITIPIYMDAVQAETLKHTLRSQYYQRLRWAYGIEHFPYVFTQAVKHKEIPLVDRVVKVYRLFEANFSWATASIFIPVVGWLPIILNKDYSQTVLAHNAPFYASRLLAVSWIGLVISILLSLQLMPQMPAKYRKNKIAEVVLQWILVPFTAIIFGSIPAIHAQTRLMLGRYMTYWTTPKLRKND